MIGAELLKKLLGVEDFSSVADTIISLQPKEYKYLRECILGIMEDNDLVKCSDEFESKLREIAVTVLAGDSCASDFKGLTDTDPRDRIFDMLEDAGVIYYQSRPLPTSKKEIMYEKLRRRILEEVDDNNMEICDNFEEKLQEVYNDDIDDMNIDTLEEIGIIRCICPLVERVSSDVLREAGIIWDI